jgi:hypothetical protein
MARRGKDLAALAAIMGAGALASRGGVDLGDVGEYTDADRREFAKTTTYKKGGYVKAADGCAKRGKTKGRLL